MAVRRFSAANDEIRVAIGSAGPTGAYTFGLLFDRANTANWHALMGTHTSASVPTNTLELNGTGGANLHKIEHGTNDSTFVLSTTTIATTNSYYLLIITKATGTATPRFHFYNLSTDGGRAAGTWTHENASSTAGNPASTAGGTMRWGEYNDIDDANMYLAAAFVRSVALSDANCEAIVTAGLKTSSLYNAGGSTSVALWEFNQASPTDAVLDLVGAAHSTGTGGVINGTTVDTGNDPPGWTFDGTGSGSQTINPGHVASTAQLFSPSFAPGAVTIQPGTIAAGSQVFAPSLAHVLAPDTVASTAQVFAPALVPGPVTVEPGHLASTAQVFAPSVGSTISVEPGHVASGAQIFAPTFAPGSVTFTPGHVASTSQVFAPSLSGGEEPEAGTSLRVPAIPTIPTMNR